ncbi:hypothetical protein [uncultured Pseudodesulfovibrio sp.]|uniref:hypothetical protein n=1 Tax=uncultured Pseudodesulfovibrio sp. TaxID=2035858 RepID=UPI0029C6F529|nr:hypothetical protein [uncultured Pseudodesulfovibrio sp.]
MKIRSFLAVLLLLAVLTSAAAAADYVTIAHPTSFRGLQWGTPLEDIPDLLPVKGAGYKATYFKKNEKLTFGDAEILSVAYYFRKDRLYRVGVAFEGRANHFLLKERLLGTYGPGRGVGHRYGWMWRDFSVELTYDDDNKTGALYYTFEGKLDQDSSKTP